MGAARVILRGELILMLVVAAHIGCARHTTAAASVAAREPVSVSDLIVIADTAQPLNADLVVRLTSCDGPDLQIHRSSADRYEWTGGGESTTWSGRDEFQMAMKGRANALDACRAVRQFFSCTPGLDTEIGATAECGEHLNAQKLPTGRLRLGGVEKHDN